MIMKNKFNKNIKIRFKRNFKHYLYRTFPQPQYNTVIRVGAQQNPFTHIEKP